MQKGHLSICVNCLRGSACAVFAGLSEMALYNYIRFCGKDLLKREKLKRKVSFRTAHGDLKGHSLHVSECPFNPFPNKPCFLRVCSTCLLKTMLQKKKLLVTSNFSISHGVSYLIGELSAIFIRFEIVTCKLCRFGTV